MTGIDTDGGVRVPAGYCGVIGFRPSYGAVSHTGIVPVSSSCDTVGMCSNFQMPIKQKAYTILHDSLDLFSDLVS